MSIQLITDKCRQLESFLIGKNQKYGNSAFDPVRMFSSCSDEEQLRVRIDDKLSRLARGVGEEDEDVILDLTGYLVLLMIKLDQKRANVPPPPPSIRITRAKGARQWVTKETSLYSHSSWWRNRMKVWSLGFAAIVSLGAIIWLVQ